MRRVVEILAAVLREVFDEAAYARFLRQQGLVSSRQTYARFLEERERRQDRRARCC